MYNGDGGGAGLGLGPLSPRDANASSSMPDFGFEGLRSSFPKPCLFAPMESFALPPPKATGKENARVALARPAALRTAASTVPATDWADTEAQPPRLKPFRLRGVQSAKTRSSSEGHHSKVLTSKR